MSAAAKMPIQHGPATAYHSPESSSPPLVLPPISSFWDHSSSRNSQTWHRLHQPSPPQAEYEENLMRPIHHQPVTADPEWELESPRPPGGGQQKRNRRRRIKTLQHRSNNRCRAPMGSDLGEMEPMASPTADICAPRSPRARGPQSVPLSHLLSDAVAEADPPRGSCPRYKIHMRQQPIAARACGFGERDRRVIDPPPIVQMTISDQSAAPDAAQMLLRQNYAVIHCVLWDPVHDRDDTIMPFTDDKRQQRRLMGTLVASPFFGSDEFGTDGCFFTFPDLSVRTPGTYSLKFSLIVLSIDRMGRGASVPVKSSVVSCPFQVFNAKDFGGMRPSTALTKRLKCQGCLISVKKGSVRANARRGGKNEGDGEHDAERRPLDSRESDT